MADETPDTGLTPVFSALRSLLIVSGTALLAHGYGDSYAYKVVEMASGSIMIVGPAIWGVWTAIKSYREKKKARTDGVNAGMNLAATGHMLIRQDGTPLPATDATAHEIVKNFGTIEAAARNAGLSDPQITDALNASQLPAKP